MHRIDHPTAASNLFTEGNPSLAQPATIVTDDWLNDVQENIVAVIAAAGVSLTKGRAADLLDAIRIVAGAGLRAGDYITYNSTPQTLTNGVLGDTVAWIGTGAAAFTLPIINTPAGNCPKGTRIEIANYGTGNLTVSRQSGDTFVTNNNGSPVASLVAIPPGGNATFESNGASSWSLVGGTLSLNYTSSLGNMSGATVLTANTTIGLSGLGTLYHLNANSLTLTIPDPSTVPNGSTIRIAIGSNTGCTVTSGATNGFYHLNSNTIITTLALGLHSVFTLTSNGAQWFVAQTGGAFVSSYAGYQILPSGIIIQWCAAANASASANTFYTFSYPIAFPNTVYSAVAANTTSAATNNGGMGIHPLSLSQFQLTWAVAGDRAARIIAIGN